MNSANPAFDIVIMGGGISGVGVALAAIQKGYRVAIIDKNRAMQATSKNSLRIIHGGFRYLQSFDFLRTRESAKAQDELLRKFGEFIKPLPCVMPLDAWGLKSAPFARVAARLYQQFMPKGHKLPAPKVLPASFVHEEIPILKSSSTEHYLYWNDAVITEPSYLAQFLVEHLISKGVRFIEDTSVLHVKFANGFFQVIAESNGTEKVILGRSVVNCAGPWIESIKTSGDFKRITQDSWALGYNVVIRKQLEQKYAFAVESPTGRMYFAVPRGKRTAIGTGYLRFAGDPSKGSVPELELGKFIEGFNSATTQENRLTRADIEEVEWGVLPVKSFSKEGINLRGRHRILHDKGYGEILSTKYTTFLPQGREIVDKIYLQIGSPA